MAVAALSIVPRSPAPATVFVRGERFRMGTEDGQPDESPVHEVEVRPLRFARTPVSNGEYAGFLATGAGPEPPWWRDPLFWDPEQPVVGVTWVEAVDYCAWLGATVGGRWRLPSEAEWEHAIASGLERQPPSRQPQVPDPLFPAGPRKVGRGPANAFGLLDPGTLVQEWCLDWYAADAYRFTRRYDPRGAEFGDRRARRGGSWRRPATPASRSAADPRDRSADGGFRPVREVP
jgi:sulfatase modifying factor 1